MDSVNAYKKIYEILNSYYQRTGNDDLAGLLSDMEPWPYKGENGKDTFGSADPAVFDGEWRNAWNEIVGSGQEGTGRQIRKVANALFAYYTNQVGCDLGEADSVVAEGLGIKTIRGTIASDDQVWTLRDGTVPSN